MCKTFWAIILTILAEVLLMLDAGYVGYLMGAGVNHILDIWVFWVFLIVAVALKFFAKKLGA